MEELRIQKFIADCGITSRRAAEEEIKKGNVTINGVIAEIGQKIHPDKDIVVFCGKKVTKNPHERHIYIMLNKPRGYVTTLSDEKGRKCVADLVSEIGVRLYPVGRLDMDSDGLLLMTNDGDLTNKLTHPSHQIPKIYNINIKNPVTEEDVLALGQKMILDGYEIKPVEISVIGYNKDITTLRMKLFEGRNRQIRKMCETRDLKITRLRRVAIGDLSLDNLPTGKWKYLTKAQVDYLKKFS